jgi:hypothetical protein
MTADRPPVKQATNAESRCEQHKNQQGHGHEPAEAHPGPENEVDSFQDNELAPHQHHPEQHCRRCLTNRRRGLPQPSLDSVLGDDDDLEDRLQQDGSEQRQGEGLADTFGKCSTNRLRTTTYTNTSTTAAALRGLGRSALSSPCSNTSVP